MILGSQHTELVVARYNEDTRWVENLLKEHSWLNVTLYNKGDPATVSCDHRCMKHMLPNVGREAHSYLHHIVQRYESLAEKTVFVQGTGQSPTAP